MHKMTLLEMVQNIASALETDEINSITDTTESLQISEVIKETFYELFTSTEVPEFMGLIKLESVSSLASPNYLKIPTDVNKFSWIKYKDFRGMTYIKCTYLNPEDFLNMTLAYPLDEVSTKLLDTADPESGLEYKVRADGPPQYYTIFNDKYVAFDSVDLENETTLQGDNSLSFGAKDVVFEMEDDFVPPLDSNLFPLLLAESKSVCFINLKQVSSAKEEQRVRRQRRKFQREKFKSRHQRNDEWFRRNNFARNR